MASLVQPSRYCKILGAFLVVPFAALFAQEMQEGDSTNTIEKEILAHRETDLSVLGKTRAVLVEAIQSGDTTKVRKVLTYIERRFDPAKVTVLYPQEEILIAYWLRDYETALSFITGEEVEEEGNRERLYPERDLMFEGLRVASENAGPQLIAGLRGSDLAPYKREFLELLFTSVIGPAGDSEEERGRFRSSMNASADEYLLAYPDSEFDPFIREHMRFVVIRSNWGFGYELGLGYLSLPTRLGQHMKDYGLFSMSIEGAYKQAYACLRIDIGAAHKLRTGFIQDGEWKDGLLVMHTGALLAGGAMFSLGNNVTVTPTVGIAFLDFSPPEDEKDKEGNDVSLSFPALAFGTNLDIPLGIEPMAMFLRVNIGYRLAMTDISLAKGGYTYITIGVDFFGRRQIRDF